MSNRLTLYFEPLDVLQFRDYRPFDAGYNVLGQSMFPLPGVFLGCVRAALFRDQNADFSKGKDFGVTEPWARDLLGSADRVGSLQLRGPLVARRDRDDKTLHPYFPMPVDLVPLEDKERSDRPHYCVLQSVRPGPEGPHFYHRRAGESYAMDRQDSPALPWSRHELGKPRGGTLFLTAQGANKYRRASLAPEAEPFALEPDDAVEDDKLLKTEDRYGVTRDPDSLTVEPQRFYLQRPYRLARDHGFAVEVELPAIPGAVEEAIRRLDGTIVQLGGRGHRARVEVLDGGLIPAHLTQPAGPARKHWFLTPAPLQTGLDAWPAGMTVVAERVQAIGGFDQANRRPRPLLRALPAGSVVHLEAAAHLHEVQAKLCGFSSGASPPNDYELERLQHAGFAMALPIGAERGES
jgi:CRISPR type III-B/RAMP module-associated protein Cmr3